MITADIGKARLLQSNDDTVEEKFQVLCTTYIALNHKRNCSIPEALAQTCWVKMEKNGKLHVDEDKAVTEHIRYYYLSATEQTDTGQGMSADMRP